jgi:hypothetical protein
MFDPRAPRMEASPAGTPADKVITTLSAMRAMSAMSAMRWRQLLPSEQ